jgi:hypothetical protein
MGVGQSFFLSIDYCHRLRENRMNTQPDALDLAKSIETYLEGKLPKLAAAELRRLHSLNQELANTISMCRNAIKGGHKIKNYDSRGDGYQQSFGLAFLEHLNNTIAKVGEKTE